MTAWIAKRGTLLAGAAVIVGLLCLFPLFHIVPLSASAPTSSSSTGADASQAVSFDAARVARKVWVERILPATTSATELAVLLRALREDPAAAAKRYSHQVGLGGAAYYFVRGSGLIVANERNRIVVEIAIDGAASARVVLRVGPLFGSVVRDGVGRLNVNEFPGLNEFNALAAEINAIVESEVLAALRARATPGARITFAACGEAPESPADGAAPGMLALVPTRAELQ